MNNLKEKFNSIYEKRKERCECAVYEMKTALRKQLIDWLESDRFANEMQKNGLSHISYCSSDCDVVDGLCICLNAYENECISGYLLFNSIKEVLSEIFNEICDDRFELKTEGDFCSSYCIKRVATIKIKE